MTINIGKSLFARAMLAGVATAAFASAAMAQGNEFKLGSITSITGKFAIIGTAQDVAVKLALKEINDAGGIMGRKVVLVTGDTQTDPTIASAEAKRLAYQEKVSAIIGPLVTQEILPTLPIFTDAKLPQISTTGSSAVTPQVGPYHFSFNNSSDTQAIVMADFAKNTLKAKKISVLADNGGQSKSGVEFLNGYVKKIGLEITGVQEYAAGGEDMTPQILSLRRANADAMLFFTSGYTDLVHLLKGRNDFGWDIPVVGQLSVPTYAPQAAKLVSADAFRGVYGQNYGGFSYCTNDAPGSGGFAKFKERLKAFSPESDGKIPAPTALYMYDSVYLMKAALEGMQKDKMAIDGPNFQQWMYKHAKEVNTLVTAKGLAPSTESHFLFGAGAYVMVERPDQSRPDGTMKRVGC